MASEQEQKVDKKSRSFDMEDFRYLIFRLGKKNYATPLLSTREVIEPAVCTVVPNTVPYFKGIANIRGEIIGLLDLKQKFSIESDGSSSSNSSNKSAIVIFESSIGTLGIEIDEVIGVRAINSNQIEKNTYVKSLIPHEYLIGIAKNNSELTFVLDLKKILDEDDLVSIGKKLAG